MPDFFYLALKIDAIKATILLKISTLIKSLLKILKILANLLDIGE